MRSDLSRLVVWIAICATTSSAAAGELVVSSDFESGSALVDGIDQASGTIRIRPAGDAQRGWPIWWYFRVDGIEPGRVLNVEIDRAPSSPANLSTYWASPARASFSIDGGKTWQQTA